MGDAAGLVVLVALVWVGGFVLIWKGYYALVRADLLRRSLVRR